MPSNVLSNNRSASRDDNGWAASRRAKAKGFKIIDSTGPADCGAYVTGRPHKPLRWATGSGGEAITASQNHFSVFRAFLLDKRFWPALGLAAVLGILPAAIQAGDGR